MFKKFIKRMQEVQMRRVAYWQMHNLSDAQLKDIGIGRSEIRRIAYHDPIPFK